MHKHEIKKCNHWAVVSERTEICSVSWVPTSWIYNNFLLKLSNHLFKHQDKCLQDKKIHISYILRCVCVLPCSTYVMVWTGGCQLALQGIIAPYCWGVWMTLPSPGKGPPPTENRSATHFWVATHQLRTTGLNLPVIHFDSPYLIFRSRSKPPV